MKKLFGKKEETEKSGPPPPATAPPTHSATAPPPHYATGQPPHYATAPPSSAPPPYDGAPPPYSLGDAPPAIPEREHFGVDAPPAYSTSLMDGSTSTVHYTGCPEQQDFQRRYVAEQAAHHGQTYTAGAGSVVHATFDAGARFDQNAPASLPPPPPGVPPTPAQLAALHGGTVVMTQKKETFMSGTGHGGSTFW